jgi:hypothetical protein
MANGGALMAKEIESPTGAVLDEPPASAPAVVPVAPQCETRQSQTAVSDGAIGAITVGVAAALVAGPIFGLIGVAAGAIAGTYGKKIIDYASEHKEHNVE